jgi:uncharacterized protein YbjT (DUF2867 family)
VCAQSLGITGASGRLGSGILRYCLEPVAARELVAITRLPANLYAAAARGVAVREGDFDKPGLEASPHFLATRGEEKANMIP